VKAQYNEVYMDVIDGDATKEKMDKF